MTIFELILNVLGVVLIWAVMPAYYLIINGSKVLGFAWGIIIAPIVALAIVEEGIRFLK